MAPPPHPAPWHQRRALRWLGAAIGLALLVAALAMVGQRSAVLVEARAALQRVSPAAAGTLLAAVLANLVLSGLMFSMLMSRYGRVGLLEMQALIAATTLFNYLPLRAGLLGRITYHRAVNQIPVTASARAVIQAMAISGLVALYLAATLALAAWSGWSLWAPVLAPVPPLALGGLSSRARPWLWAALARYLDVLAWAVRYDAAFRMLGSPIESSAALALACVSVIASLIPLVGNGLGVREWAIGLAAPLVAARHLELGLSAELVNRAAELVAVTCAGLLAVGWLTARRRLLRASPPGPGR